jgi:hypothetical protein
MSVPGTELATGTELANRDLRSSVSFLSKADLLCSTCVKTHTEKICRKNNFLAGRRTTPAQYDLTLTGRNCFKTFYACEACRSFHTAWTLSGLKRVDESPRNTIVKARFLPG